MICCLYAYKGNISRRYTSLAMLCRACAVSMPLLCRFRFGKSYDGNEKHSLLCLSRSTFPYADSMPFFLCSCRYCFPLSVLVYGIAARFTAFIAVYIRYIIKRHGYPLAHNSTCTDTGIRARARMRVYARIRVYVRAHMYTGIRLLCVSRRSGRVLARFLALGNVGILPVLFAALVARSSVVSSMPLYGTCSASNIACYPLWVKHSGTVFMPCRFCRFPCFI